MSKNIDDSLCFFVLLNVIDITTQGNNMMNKNKNQESGLSLLEMIGVLSIVGGALFGVFTIWDNMKLIKKNNTIDDDLLRIVRGARALYNSQPDFAGLDDSLLQFVFDSKEIKNPYDGVYHLIPDNNRGFVVNITNLDPKGCVSLNKKSFTSGGISGGCIIDNNNVGKYYMNVTFTKEDKDKSL